MSKELFELAILISLKDAASGQMDRVGDRLRMMGAEGRATMKTFDDLRRDMRQGIEMAGIGVAGLMALKSGVTAAAEFESAMTDLKMSIGTTTKDGTVDLAKMNDQVNRLGTLAIRLGNTLPGSTQDFLELFTTLRQGGMATEDILNGAGEKAAKLALVSHLVPKELGPEFAQLSKMFSLKPEEYSRAADIVSKMQSVGLMPAELIQGAKFAQLRGGLPLGMEGIGGMQTIMNLLGTLKVRGLGGGIGGREMANVLMELVPNKGQKKVDAELLKKFGIKLEFFDKKGQFSGEENLVKQLEKLNVLTPYQRDDLLKRRFSAVGVGPASALMKSGAAGFKEFREQVESALGVEQKAALLTEDWNSKLMNVEGTMKNVVATTFTPLLDTLKPVLDATNSLLAEFQEFSKAHPEIAKDVTEFVALGSILLVVVGGFKAMRAAYGLWKIASAIGSGERGLLSFLTATKVESEAAGVAMEGAAVKGSMLKQKLGTGITIAVALVGFEFVFNELSRLIAMKHEAEEGAKDAAKGAADATHKAQAALTPEQFLAQQRGSMGTNVGLVAQPDTAGFLETWKSAMMPSNSRSEKGDKWYDALFAGMGHGANLALLGQPALAGHLAGLDKTGLGGNAAERFGNLMPELKGSALELGLFTEAVRKSKRSEQEKDALISAARGFAGAEAAKKYDAALEKAANDENAALLALAGDEKSLAASLADAGTAAENFAKRANTALETTGGGKPDATPTGPLAVHPRVKRRAMGGDVLSEGLLYAHAGERVQRAADVTRGYNDSGRGRGDVHLHAGAITINVPAGSRAADDPRALAKMVADQVNRQRERD